MIPDARIPSVSVEPDTTSKTPTTGAEFRDLEVSTMAGNVIKIPATDFSVAMVKNWRRPVFMGLSSKLEAFAGRTLPSLPCRWEVALGLRMDHKARKQTRPLQCESNRIKGRRQCRPFGRVPQQEISQENRWSCLELSTGQCVDGFAPRSSCHHHGRILGLQHCHSPSLLQVV
ncbi:unnamed protein product [Cladocopium goreaui]|uniref:Uncharacterized protein n=1 Tax=Cladocopium goreaui TaxID=2562237 RepID=A0A9P1DH62_9DINO|nr:unnamed protein product [Cladocopium goreaui]